MFEQSRKVIKNTQNVYLPTHILKYEFKTAYFFFIIYCIRHLHKLCSFSHIHEVYYIFMSCDAIWKIICRKVLIKQKSICKINKFFSNIWKLRVWKKLTSDKPILCLYCYHMVTLKFLCLEKGSNKTPETSAKIKIIKQIILVRLMSVFPALNIYIYLGWLHQYWNGHQWK